MGEPARKKVASKKTAKQKSGSNAAIPAISWHTVTVKGTDAIRELIARRRSYPTTGEYPFIIGSADDERRLREFNDNFARETPAEIINAAESIDIPAWFRERENETEPPEDVRGTWRGDLPQKHRLSLHMNDDRVEPRRIVHIGLATVPCHWQLPAALTYGNWNDCPAPALHCAIHRRWGETYGARIAGVSGDVIECTVTKPPRTKAEAIKLAYEQYWYCNDIVEQGCETIHDLAGLLINADAWFFWWD